MTIIYVRASTEDQDASRALESLQQFASDNELTISRTYVENCSGAKLDRPELNKLLAEAPSNTVLLVESMDRLSRLSQDEWSTLKNRIETAGLRLVVVDIPTTHMNLSTSTNSDDITTRIMQAVNGMLIEIMATMAREDYLKRRQRQAQGIAKAQAKGKYKGRPQNTEMRQQVTQYLQRGDLKYAEIAKLCNCSLGMVAKVASELKSTSK